MFDGGANDNLDGYAIDRDLDEGVLNQVVKEMRDAARKRNFPIDVCGTVLMYVSIVVLFLPQIGWEPLLPWVIAYAVMNLVSVSGLMLTGNDTVWDARFDHFWSATTTLAVASLPWLTPEMRTSTTLVSLISLVFVTKLASHALYMPQAYFNGWQGWVYVELASLSIGFTLGGFWYLTVVLSAVTAYLFIGTNSLEVMANSLIVARLASESRATKTDQLAHHDELSGCLNRRGLERHLHELLDSVQTVTCAFLDIDDMKQINGLFGHKTGDLAIVATADHLKRTLGDSWVVARMCGDEFVAVCAEPNAEADIKRLAPTLTRFTGADDLVLSTSIGLTQLDAEKSTLDRILNEAASAMRHAKETDKGRLVLVDETMRRQFAQQVAVSSNVEAALRDGEIVAWGQTIHHAATGRIEGVECLARWERPDGSIALPGSFLPALERRGLSIDLGFAMLNQGLAFARRAAAITTDHPPYVAVNISPGHFASESLVPAIADALHRHQVPPHLLTIEVVESHNLLDLSGWRRTAQRLRDMGVQLAIDDFGAGYSTLSEIIEFSPDIIKIDRTVTQAASSTASYLIAGVIDYATAANFTTIAEGVETPEELAAVQALGAEFVQGWLFGKPARLDDVLERIERSELAAVSDELSTVNAAVLTPDQTDSERRRTTS